MTTLFEDTYDIAGDYELAEETLTNIKKRLASVLKSMFGTGTRHCEIQGRTIFLELTIDTVSEDFPRKLFAIGFNEVHIKLSNGTEKTWIEQTKPGIGPNET
jgi:hypothetical protein